jgi:hypothetical protein
MVATTTNTRRAKMTAFFIFFWNVLLMKDVRLISRFCWSLSVDLVFSQNLNSNSRSPFYIRHLIIEKRNFNFRDAHLFVNKRKPENDNLGQWFLTGVTNTKVFHQNFRKRSFNIVKPGASECNS